MVLTRNRHHKLQKRKAHGSAKRLDVGKEMDRLIESRKKKYGEHYGEAQAAIAKRNPALYKKWLTGAGSHVYRDFGNVAHLARFLNDPSDNAQLLGLRELLPPILNWYETRPTTLRDAATKLAKKLDGIPLSCHVVLEPRTKPRFVFGKAAGINPFYGLVLTVLTENSLSKLRQCESCENFFATDDHRTKYCTGTECGRKQRKAAAREGMKALRERNRKSKEHEALKRIEFFREHLNKLDEESGHEKTVTTIRSGFADGLKNEEIAKKISTRGLKWLNENY